LKAVLVKDGLGFSPKDLNVFLFRRRRQFLLFYGFLLGSRFLFQELLDLLMGCELLDDVRLLLKPLDPNPVMFGEGSKLFDLHFG
jgi:hypothetical protein